MKTIVKNLLITLLAISVNGTLNVKAQPDWTIYNTNNSGLPSDIVYAVEIDHKGDKWIGTMLGGLAHFDGISWTVYNTNNSALPSNTVNAIDVDALGNIWVGTQDGLAKYDHNNWTVFNSDNSGLPSNFVSSVTVAPNGNKWIGLGDALAVFDDVNWKIYDQSNSVIDLGWITDIVFHPNNEIWIAWGAHGQPDIGQGGISKYTGADWTNFNADNSNLPYNYFMSVTYDANGDIWAGNWKGLAFYDHTEWTVYNSENSELPNDIVYVVRVDVNDKKWIGTEQGGLAVIDGNEWTVFDINNSDLPVNRVHSIKINENNDKWIGTYNGGLVHIPNEVRAEFTLGSDTILCEGESITLKPHIMPHETIEWNTGSTQKEITITETGEYFATVTSNSETYSDTINIYFSPKPTVYTGPDQAFCGFVDYHIEPETNGKYFEWNTGDTTKNLYVDEAGTYWLRVENEQMCDNADTVKIAEIAYPYALDDNEIKVCSNAAVLDAGNPGATYQWSTGETTRSIVVTQSGMYSVVISNGYCETEDYINVTFLSEDECVHYFWLPNAFSPNGDGLNDIFRPEFSLISSFSMSIYDRWGSLIHQTTDPEEGWNGYSNGKLMPESTYLYIVEYKYENDNQIMQNRKYGSLHLVR